MKKCPNHPGAGEVFDQWPSFGKNTWLGYCRVCNTFLGQKVMDGIVELNDDNTMKWGKYNCVKLKDVPMSYLKWCVDAAMGSDAWNIALQRYLKRKEEERD